MKNPTWQQLRKTFLEVVYKIRGEHVFNNLNEIRLSERLTHEEFLSYQSDKLLELINFLKTNICFYRNITPSSVGLKHNAIDLSNIDAMDRHVIIPKLNEFIDKNLRASWRSTSGTSGTPFIFPKDRYATGYMDAIMYQAYGWHGVKVGDKQARLWGGALSGGGRVSQVLKDSLLGRKRLSVFQCNQKTYSDYFDRLQLFKPKYFYAYANALYQFALYVEETEKKGKLLNVSVAICTGEMLFPHQREKIKEVFGCRVVNEYGSTENGIIAFECEAGNMHIMPTIFLEIDDPDNEGFGQVILTELNSRSIPFLRYRLGDIARRVEGECVCGRTLPLIEIGSGRVNDQIICPDGTIVYATVIAYALKKYVREFRAIQKSNLDFEIQIVPQKEWDIRLQKKIDIEIRKYLGPEMNIRYTIVPKIFPEKTGKLRYFISNISR